jgi:hypothetical protein
MRPEEVVPPGSPREAAETRVPTPTPQGASLVDRVWDRMLLGLLAVGLLWATSLTTAGRCLPYITSQGYYRVMRPWGGRLT